ncbi:MAG: hypothetical protein DRP19_01575 [Thermotogae bacterium]|nr:MAG: hypothetical protein DRP19_01575 [Thermotogota bacterium]
MILAIDYGEARCGLALGQTIPAKAWVCKTSHALKTCLEQPVDRYIVGMPLSMSGRYSSQTFLSIAFAECLWKKSEKDVILVDERLTSKMFSGRKGRDALSAVEIFKSFVEGAIHYKLHLPTKIDDSLITFISKKQKCKVLVVNVSDVRVVSKCSQCVVVQKDPYYAYLFHKMGCHVERDLKRLKKSEMFDIIVTDHHTPELNDFVESEENIFCACSSKG